MKEEPTTIHVHAIGRTREDAVDAVEEALRRLRSGFSSGFDSNATYTPGFTA